jgi:UDP-glucuronate decarboxylase
MSKILVTGGAGFLGSHLCKLLVEHGDEVVCLDNFYTGNRENLKQFGLFDYQSFEFIRHDVIEPIILEVDEIYHLACPASPIHYQSHPVKTIKTAVQGTLNVLDMAREVGAKVLIASTSEVYGDPQIHPQVESYWGHVNPVGPRACYDEGKRCAESLAVSYNQQYGVDVRIARIFNTYGPVMHPPDGRVVSNFIMQALRGEDITVYGDGAQTRSFCYVNDLIIGFQKLMGLNSNPGPVNLGNPEETSVLELAEMVIRETRSVSKVKREPLPVDDPIRRKPDIGKAMALLGWKPTIPLKLGLGFTVDYFKKVVNYMTPGVPEKRSR